MLRRPRARGGRCVVGALTNLVNPKIGAFYVAVLPQFIPEGASPIAMGLLLAFVHDLEGMLWLTVLIVGANEHVSCSGGGPLDGWRTQRLGRFSWALESSLAFLAEQLPCADRSCFARACL